MPLDLSEECFDVGTSQNLRCPILLKLLKQVLNILIEYIGNLVKIGKSTVL